MRVRTHAIRLALPVVLAALVCALAVLQYRWLGQASEAERAQMVRSLSQRASDVANLLDRELTQAYLAHQLTQDALRARDWSSFAAAAEKWRTTAWFPQMIRAVYLVEHTDDALVLHRYDSTAKSFATDAMTWPEHLAVVRDRLMPRAAASAAEPGGAIARRAQWIAMAMTPAVADAFAVVVPMAPASQDVLRIPSFPTATAPGVVTMIGGLAGTPTSSAAVIIELDREVMTRTVLPALVEQVLPDGGGDAYRVAILGAGSQLLYARGVPAGSTIDPKTADVTVPMFSIRTDLVRGDQRGPGAFIVREGVLLGGSAAAGAPTPSSTTSTRMSIVVEQRSAGPAEKNGARTIRVSLPDWRLLVQHPAGSLDAAVSRTRLRNLWLSFGILGVLALGVAIVVVNARRAETLAARQMEFVATVTHELRTPLAVIRSAAQNLSAGVIADAEQARRYGGLIDDEGRRLGDTVEQVLALAGLEGGRRQQGARPIEVRALVAAEVEALDAPARAAGIALDVTGVDDGNPLLVMGDESLLRRALHNLVENAIKHGADGKWIGIQVAEAGRGGSRQAEITVRDRGRGIDAADLPHIFEPFFRGRHALDQQIQGSGLGLNLVKRIAEAAGGSVHATSAPGEGATFVLRLPLTLEGTSQS